MQSKVITAISFDVNLAQFVLALPAEDCWGWEFALPFKITVFALLTFLE